MNIFEKVQPYQRHMIISSNLGRSKAYI